MTAMDDDLANLTREGLIAEVMRLRAGIRAHRDSSGHNLCWHHPQLWCQSLFRKTSPSLTGLSFCGVASSIGSHSTDNFQTLHARMQTSTKALNRGSRRPHAVTISCRHASRPILRQLRLQHILARGTRCLRIDQDRCAGRLTRPTPRASADARHGSCWVLRPRAARPRRLMPWVPICEDTRCLAGQTNSRSPRRLAGAL